MARDPLRAIQDAEPWAEHTPDPIPEVEPPVMGVTETGFPDEIWVDPPVWFDPESEAATGPGPKPRPGLPDDSADHEIVPAPMSRRLRVAPPPVRHGRRI